MPLGCRQGGDGYLDLGLEGGARVALGRPVQVGKRLEEQEEPRVAPRHPHPAPAMSEAGVNGHLKSTVNDGLTAPPQYPHLAPDSRSRSSSEFRHDTRILHPRSQKLA